MIVCTHSHPDHSPGARPLQALCSGKPPILGLPSAPTARPRASSRPTARCADGEATRARRRRRCATRLKVIHTPGHAANHLCLVLLEDGLLFSGDHILNGSTTVVDPPDGDMTAYLDSLDQLSAACETHGIEFILPAHGYVLGFAAQGHRAPEGAPAAARGQGHRRHAGPAAGHAGGLGRAGLRRRAARACGRWPSARCWPTCSASRRWAWRREPAQLAMTEPVRLAKHVAALVPCSRREAEQYIEGGWVRVDGHGDRGAAVPRDRREGRTGPGRQHGGAGAGHAAAAQARRHCVRRSPAPAGAREPGQRRRPPASAP